MGVETRCMNLDEPNKIWQHVRILQVDHRTTLTMSAMATCPSRSLA